MLQGREWLESLMQALPLGTFVPCANRSKSKELTESLSNGDLLKTSPMGWDSGEAGITVDGAIRGSVNSFFAGDFGYDASNPYKDTLGAGKALSSEQVDSLSKLEITEETAGLFNIPVCQIYDLRFFPPASGSKSLHSLYQLYYLTNVHSVTDDLIL